MANLALERNVQKKHAVALIAGVDEAGRGALAGPVVAGAVILPLQDEARLAHLTAVNDSKQLSAKKRAHFYDLITQHALAWGVGMVSASQIDRIGILPATRMAMATAVQQLLPAPGYLLIDGRVRLATLPIPQQAIIRGDALSLSIAAASIIAKVSRDRHMIALDEHYPAYGLAQHKGYGTAAHRHIIQIQGGTAVHRHSFAPLRHTLL